MISGGHVNAIWFLKSSFVRLRDDDDSGGGGGGGDDDDDLLPFSSPRYGQE